MSLPHLPFLIVVVAAVLIVFGRVRRRTAVAIAGFVLLALAALLVLLGYRQLRRPLEREPSCGL